MKNKTLTWILLIGLPFFSGCIKEDDGNPPALNLPEISIADLSIQEDDEDVTASVAVTLSSASNTNVVVSYAATAGTADAGIDFKSGGGGRLVFSPGETQKTIPVTIIGDEIVESTETFTVTLYNPQNARLAKNSATVSIEDDDTPGPLVIPGTGYSTPITYAGFNLVWADEFSGTSLDPSSWNFETGDGCPGNCGWGNNELQYYRAENTSVQDGYLVIEAKRQNFGGRQYTSSRITTKGKKQFRYGRIDIRAALPEGQGLWPALWMLGANIDQKSWPACGEIDIMELTGDQPGRALGTVHFGPDLAGHQYVGSSTYLANGAKFSEEFHVFSLNWDQNIIQFLVDNKAYLTITPSSLNGQAYPFNNPFFFIFNVAVGGNLPGNPDNGTPLPQRLIVDYIRVFQK